MFQATRSVYFWAPFNIYIFPDFCIRLIIVGRVRGNAIPAVPLLDQNNLFGTKSSWVLNPRLFEARAKAIGPLCHAQPCECSDAKKSYKVGYWTVARPPSNQKNKKLICVKNHKNTSKKLTQWNYFSRKGPRTPLLHPPPHPPVATCYSAINISTRSLQQLCCYLLMC